MATYWADVSAAAIPSLYHTVHNKGLLYDKQAYLEM